MRKTTGKKKEGIKVRPEYKRRTPHRPTRPHRDRTKYTRKGRAAERIRKAIRQDQHGG